MRVSGPAAGVDGGEGSMLIRPPLNLWFYVGFLGRVAGRIDLCSRLVAEPGAPEDVNRHGRGCQQQRRERDKKDHQ